MCQFRYTLKPYAQWLNFKFCPPPAARGYGAVAPSADEIPEMLRSNEYSDLTDIHAGCTAGATGAWRIYAVFCK